LVCGDSNLEIHKSACSTMKLAIEIPKATSITKPF
jgi:hypothetical protein